MSLAFPCPQAFSSFMLIEVDNNLFQLYDAANKVGAVVAALLSWCPSSIHKRPQCHDKGMIIQFE